DVNFWDREAHALFEEIQAAYRVLSDPSARTLYDHQARLGERPAEGAGGRRAARRRGDDLHAPIELGFAQAAQGLATDLVLERLSPCGTCGATGPRPGASPTACSHCGGVGMVWGGDGTPRPTPCPACAGEGER